MWKTKYPDLKTALLSNIEIDPDTGCWNWQKSVTQNRGYGRLTFEKVEHRVHRLAYELFKGEINDGLFVCYKCKIRDAVILITCIWVLTTTICKTVKDRAGMTKAQKKN